MNSTEKILLVDDDKDLLRVYKEIFEMNGFLIETVQDSTKVREILSCQKIAVVITDIIMPKLGGMELLKLVKELSPSTEVIMLTGEGTVQGAVKAVHMGAFTYLIKPADIDELLMNINKALELYRVKEKVSVYKQQLYEGYDPLIGKNIEIQKIRDKIAVIGPTDVNVLITGESGTGKEILANLIYKESDCGEKPFIKVNCAALTEGVFESELFGHEKGSFTGAEKSYCGRFEMANHGVILLDEIGELSIGQQSKLLRVLQEKEFERVGSTRTIKTDFRLITSTNKNLQEEVTKGNFREDLFYRINAFTINIPPLRDRKDDIPVLVEYFAENVALELKKSKPIISLDIMDIFIGYDWPGNVRELKNIIERLVVMSSGSTVNIEAIPEEVRNYRAKVSEGEDYDNTDTSLTGFREKHEREYILEVLNRNAWNISSTALELKIARKNLYNKMKKYGL